LATGWRDKDDGKGRRKIALVETRGEGGYFLIPPSGGRAHRTGRSYRYLQGDLARPPILSWDEHEILWDCARSLDELPEHEETASVTAPRPLRRARRRDPGEEPARGVRAGGGVRPGEDYNQRGDWTDLLEGAGWTKAHTVEDVERWRRPGKERGHSATLGYIANRFYVFSTSAAPLRPLTSYDKFALYAVLHHGGDYSAAARDLWHQGYGRLATTQRGQTTTAPRCDDLPAILAEDSDPVWGEASAEDDIASAMEDQS
jgi:hypothetical protein